MITGYLDTRTHKVRGIYKRSALDRSAQTYWRKVRALWSIAERDSLRVYAVELTLSEANAYLHDNKAVSAFCEDLRAKVGSLEYVWVVAIQEERLRKYGEIVLHWHLFIASPHSLSRDEIRTLWGRGFVRLKRLHSNAEFRGKAGYVYGDFKRDIRVHFPRLRRCDSSKMEHFAFKEWEREYVEEARSRFPELVGLRLRRHRGRVSFLRPDGSEAAGQYSPYRPVALKIISHAKSGDSLQLDTGGYRP